MAKNLNVNMNFTADVSNVENNLNKLKTSLNQISTTPIKIGTVSEDLKQATVSARQLQVHLNNAFSTKTGNLDLAKLQTSLEQSGQSLSQLSANLMGAGKNGQQAFLQLQTAIQNANLQIKQSTGFLSEMGTVLKNTVRWQISSSLLHGFMSNVQQAYSYVQKLDKSLNNIRIVSGASAEDMAKFAEQANKSAKALSTTTTAYTNAALIYYQQGLTDQEVKERTDITMKMSNVTGESADKVSSYMTAIWNNFANGSDNLERFADIIARLGADTASSSEEIAGGLEKFAAIGKTVGLSYEYATSALATVVAKTRQTPEVVGTAFKTLFARIQDLELGNTLEDGTTLGTYSQALEKVGINIKDTSGQLKNMDVILEEMGNKWQTLSKDQQVALAQNVASTRQYTQLVALMENWDFFQQNLKDAQNAEGSLQEQADIYAESWEGARKRVKASAQAIYSDLIDDKTFIKGTNAVADVLNVTDELITNLGGIKSLLLTISSIVISKLKPTMIESFNQGLSNLTLWRTNIKEATLNEHNIWSKTKLGLKASTQPISDLQTQEAQKEMREVRNNQLSNDNLTAAYKARLIDMNKIEDVQNNIIFSSKKLTNEEKEKLAILQKQASTLSEQKMLKQEQLATSKKQKENLISDRVNSFYDDKTGLEYFRQTRNNSGQFAKYEYTKGTGIMPGSSNWKQYQDDKIIADLGINIDTNDKNNKIQAWGSEESLITAGQRVLEQTVSLNEIQAKINAKKELELTNVNSLKEEYSAIIEKAYQQKQITEEQRNAYIKTINDASEIDSVTENIENKLNSWNISLQKFAKLLGVSAEEMKNAAIIGEKMGTGTLEAAQATQAFNDKLAETQQFLTNAIEKTQSLGGTIQAGIQGVANLAMGLQMVKSAWETWNNEDASLLDKIVSTTFALPMLTTGFITIKKNIVDISQGLKGMQVLLSLQEPISDSISTLENMADLKIEKQITQELIKQGGLEEIIEELKAKGLSEEAAQIVTQEAANQAATGETVQITRQYILEKLKNKEKAIGLALTSKYLIIAAAVVAAVAAIGIAIYKYNDRFNDALKDATAATKEAKEAADSAQQEYDSLLSTITNCKDAKTALGQLTKGTDEWKQKVMEINTQVLELMDNYSGLAQYVTSEDGVLSISDEGFNYLTETAYQRAQTTQNTYATKAIEQNKAEDNVTTQQLSKDLNISFSKAEQLINDYNNNIDGARETIEKLDGKVDDTNGKVAEAASAVLENTIATSALTDQIATNSFTGQDWYDNSDRKEAYNIAYGKQVNKVLNDELSVYEPASKLYQWAGEQGYSTKFGTYDLTQSGKDKIAADRYGEDSGYYLGNYNSITGKYNIYDKNESKVGTITYEEALKELKINSLKDSFAKDEVPKINTTLDKLETNISSAIGKVKLNNDEITKLAVDAYKLKQGESVDFSNYSSQALDALLKTSSKDKNLSPGTQKLVAGAQNYVNTQLYNPAKEVSIKDLQKTYTDPYLKNKFDLGISGVDISKAENSIKEQYNTAWKKAVNEVAKSQGESETAVAQVLIEYQDKFGAFSKDNHSFDTDKLTDFYKTQKKAKLTVEIENKAEAIATETGLDSEDIKSYAQQLSNMKKYANYSADALTNLAKAQLRYEKAVANSKDNLSDWKKELKKAGKEALLSTETYQGLQDAYGDLFDIDGSLLSDSFIRSTKNADLLEKAIKGDTKAYKKLKEQAVDSIEVKFGLDKDSNFDEQINTLKGTISRDLGDFKVGVDIDVDQKDFYKQINNLANYLYSLGLTAEQVGDVIVSELGIDADVTEVTGEPEEKVVAYNMIPKSTSGAATTVFLPGGNAQDVSAPGIEWETEPVTATLESSTSASSVKVSNARKTSGGKIKKAMAGGKSLGKAKKSGGRSGKNPSTKTFKDDFNSSIERYHSIDRKIDKTTKAYEELSDAKDKAYGIKRLSIMDKETDNIKKQISLEEKKLKQAQKYTLKDKKALVDAAAEAGTDVDFGPKGEIKNYVSMLKRAEKQVKKAYDTKDDDKIEKAKKKYQNLVDAISQYEETLDTTIELQDEMKEGMQQLADIELEKITYKVDLKLDFDERQLKLIDQKLSQWERTNISGYYDATYVDKQTEKLANQQSQYDTSKQAIKDILAKTTIGTGKKARYLTKSEIQSILDGTVDGEFLESTNLSKSQIESIQRYSDAMLDAANEIASIQDEIYQIFANNMEQYKEDFDKQMSIVEHQKNIVSSLQEIFTLANKDDVELLNKMREAVISASETQGLAYRQNMENATEQIRLLQDRLNTTTSEAEKKMLTENIEAWQEYYRENNENMLSSVQNALSAIKEKLEANVEEIKKMYEEALSGGYGSFSNLELSMDMSDEIRDSYVPAYEKIYNLSKLTQDIQKSMDDTDSIKGKQKLLSLQKRINAAMEEGVELTQYDLDRMNAEYQLELAKIALEEAQNTKKNVRMQRDNFGNWSYVYTADEDKVAEAMSKYEESIYNLRKLDDERDRELERSIVDINTKYFERLQQIMEMDGGEAKDNALAQLKDWYNAMLASTLEYANTVAENEKRMFDEEADSYEKNTGRKIDALGKWITSFGQTSAMIKSGYSTMDGALDGYKEAVDKYTDQVVNEYVKAQDDANNVMEKFGLDVNYATGSVDELNTSLSTTVDKIKEIGDNLSKITQEDLDKMDAINRYDKTVEESGNSVSKVNQSIGALAGVGQAATGAYTGDWNGSDGKLMFLHQKELILNKDETKAFFNVASLLEKINLPTLFTPMLKQIELANINNKNDKLEQSVMIKAEFPNVTKHNEIEMAIDNLINKASQYANRKY